METEQYRDGDLRRACDHTGRRRSMVLGHPLECTMRNFRLLICCTTCTLECEKWNKYSRRTTVGKPHKQPSKLRKVYRAAQLELMPYEKQVS